MKGHKYTNEADIIAAKAELDAKLLADGKQPNYLAVREGSDGNCYILHCDDIAAYMPEPQEIVLPQPEPEPEPQQENEFTDIEILPETE